MPDPEFMCDFPDPRLIPKKDDLAFREKVEPAQDSISLDDANMTDKRLWDGEDGEHDSFSGILWVVMNEDYCFTEFFRTVRAVWIKEPDVILPRDFGSREKFLPVTLGKPGLLKLIIQV
jgi:hypothetical protein